MSVAALAIVLGLALAAMAVVLNHCYARVALVELALNEGLPPGHQPTSSMMVGAANAVDPATVLAAGIHVFLSRNCHACQRLIDELDQIELVHDTTMSLHYVDRPRPIASAVAERHRAALLSNRSELATRLGADPLPYTIVIGAHELVARAVTPTVAQLLVAARDGGMSIEVAANA